MLEISKSQGLGLAPKELPLIIHTDLATYTMAYLMYEDEEYLIIAVPDKDGAELAKIIPKTTILGIEVIYQQMLNKPKDTKGDVLYG